MVNNVEGAKSASDSVDVLLVGGGIVSATLGAMIQRVHPEWSLTVFERLDEVALANQQAFQSQLASLVTEGAMREPSTFINNTPHMAFVRGDANQKFLRERFRLMSEHPFFHDM